eukprot:gene11637-4878_t
MENVDVFISSKTGFELDSLTRSCLNLNKSWENSKFLEDNFTNNPKLKNVEQQIKFENWIEEELKFEFGTSKPKIFDQFQIENNLFHFINYLMDSKVFDTFPEKFQIRKIQNFEKEKVESLSKLNLKNDENIGILSFIYLKEKNYEKSLLLLQRIFEKFQNVYLSILLSLISILNHNFKLAAYYLQKSIDLKIPTNMEASCFMWIGFVYETLDCQVWAVEAYQECLKLIKNSSQTFHWFVSLPFVHLKIGIIFQNFETSSNIEIAKSYYLNAYNSYSRLYRTFIELSEFTIKYQKACIGIRLANIYYLESNFEESIKFLKSSEMNLQQIQSIESQQDSIKDIIYHLHETQRRIAINYCQLKNYKKSKCYVKYPSRFTMDTSSMTYKEQLELKTRENKRIERESKYLSQDVIEQNHIVAFLALVEISLFENDMISFCELVEMMLRPNVIEFPNLPLIKWQRIISNLIKFGEFKQAQLTLSKCMLIHKKYVLGWYVLFLLGIVNMDKVKFNLNSQKLRISLKDL